MKHTTGYWLVILGLSLLVYAFVLPPWARWFIAVAPICAGVFIVIVHAQRQHDSRTAVEKVEHA